MKPKSPSIETLKELLDYNPLDGVFRWRKHTRWTKPGKEAGSITTTQDGKRYRYISIERKLYLAHRLAWLYVNGVMPDEQIDHINGSGTDNRICNLRLATNQQNSMNQRLRRGNTTGALGVRFDKRRGKYSAHIQFSGKHKFLGYFDSVALAKEARKAADKIYGFDARHGEERPL